MNLTAVGLRIADDLANVIYASSAALTAPTCTASIFTCASIGRAWEATKVFPRTVLVEDRLIIGPVRVLIEKISPDNVARVIYAIGVEAADILYLIVVRSCRSGGVCVSAVLGPTPKSATATATSTPTGSTTNVLKRSAFAFIVLIPLLIGGTRTLPPRVKKSPHCQEATP